MRCPSRRQERGYGAIHSLGELILLAWQHRMMWSSASCGPQFGPGGYPTRGFDVFQSDELQDECSAADHRVTGSV